MLDILMKEGDLVITQGGDIVLADSVRQAIRIRLLWFAAEWRFNTDFGIPYYEEILIKNPNLEKVKLILSGEIRKVEEVMDVQNMSIELDYQHRIANVTFTVYTSEEVFDMEVALGV